MVSLLNCINWLMLNNILLFFLSCRTDAFPQFRRTRGHFECFFDDGGAMTIILTHLVSNDDHVTHHNHFRSTEVSGEFIKWMCEYVCVFVCSIKPIAGSSALKFHSFVILATPDNAVLLVCSLCS